MNVPQEMLDDFRNHMWACFKYLGLGEPTPAQYAMADELQNGPKDMQLQAGRGFGKSVITSCLASWFLLKDSNSTIMVVSATGQKAVEFISMTRRILDLVPYCQDMKPGEGTIDNAFSFNVQNRTKIGQDRSCYARGITGQITGSHAEYLIFDDIEIEGNCETTQARHKLLNKALEAEQIRNVGGRVILLGTPQTKDSIYNVLKEGYPVVKFPAIKPDPSIPSESEDVSEWVMSLDIEPGDPTQPERFSKDVLMERKAKVGPTLFGLHYKLDTSLADAEKYPLKLEDLIVLDFDHELVPEKVVWAASTENKKVPSFGMSGDKVYEPMWISERFVEPQQKFMFVDPSGRGKDETAYCVASTSCGYVFIHELSGLEGGYSEAVLKKICKIALENEVQAIIAESNYGDAMFNKLLIPVMQKICPDVGLMEEKVTGAKEVRIIRSLEPVMSQHRLCFNTKAIKEKETQIQITRLTERRGALAHDDRVDVLSLAVNQWKDHLTYDVDALIEKNQEKEAMEIVEGWISDDRVGTLFGDKISGGYRYVDRKYNQFKHRPILRGRRSR
jgi:hypothetical protein